MLNTNLTRMAFLPLLLASAILPVQAANISGKVIVPRAPNNQDVVIYIDKIPGKVFAPPAKPEILDQLNLKFVPHVLPILVGTTVQFPNSDLVRHNVFSPGPVQKFNLGTYPVGKSATRVFKDPGVVTLLCNIHAEMSGYVVVTETPYYAKSDAQGNFTIPNVPPGRYVLRAWHEKYPKVPPREITVTADDLKDVNFDLSKK